SARTNTIALIRRFPDPLVCGHRKASAGRRSLRESQRYGECRDSASVVVLDLYRTRPLECESGCDRAAIEQEYEHSSCDHPTGFRLSWRSAQPGIPDT